MSYQIHPNSPNSVKPRRYKRIRIDEQFLVTMFNWLGSKPRHFYEFPETSQLPEGTRVVRVYYDHGAMCLIAVVEHESFPQVPDMTPPPFVDELDNVLNPEMVTRPFSDLCGKGCIAEQHAIDRAVQIALRDSDQQLDELRKVQETLISGLTAVEDLIANSSGAVGVVHGDSDEDKVYPWVDFLEGGRFGEWLSDYSRAIALADQIAERQKAGATQKDQENQKDV